MGPIAAPQQHWKHVKRDVNGESAILYIDFTTILRRASQPSAKAQDFLLVAAVVYALDKVLLRKPTDDRWTRSFEVEILVKESEHWTRLATMREAHPWYRRPLQKNLLTP